MQNNYFCLPYRVPFYCCFYIALQKPLLLRHHSMQMNISRRNLLLFLVIKMNKFEWQNWATLLCVFLILWSPTTIRSGRKLIIYSSGRDSKVILQCQIKSITCRSGVWEFCNDPESFSGRLLHFNRWRWWQFLLEGIRDNSRRVSFLFHSFFPTLCGDV